MPSKEFQAVPTLAEFVTEDSNINLFAVAALTAAVFERATERSAPVISVIARNIKCAATGALLINVAADVWRNGEQVLPQNDRTVPVPGAAIFSYGNL